MLARRFDVTISGLGVFARKGKVETLWAGVAEADALTGLHHKIDRSLVRIGFEPEGRAFKPHITLARFGRRGADVSALLARHGGLVLPPFTVEGFYLYESHTHSDGADYTVIARYPLDPKGAGFAKPARSASPVTIRS